MSSRTFIAIKLDDGAADALARCQRHLSASGADVKWTAAENFHITLKFLGDASDMQFSQTCNIVDEVASDYNAFEYALGSVRAVPAARRMRMVWADIDAAGNILEEIAAELDSRLADIGFKPEGRVFRPHVTVGRVKSGKNISHLRQMIESLEPVDIPLQSADELTVYTSQLTRHGPIYTPASKAYLG